MLNEITEEEFKNYFREDPHPFISIPFLNLNRRKVERLVYLIEDTSRKISMGFIAGVIENKLISPFSAPFGGFHFNSDEIYINEIDSFLIALRNYITKNKYLGFKIILPPDFYHRSFNSKVINSMLRNNFKMSIPEITNYIDLNKFSHRFNNRKSRNYFNQATRNRLSFELVTNTAEKEKIYSLIVENRQNHGRPIFMAFQDILDTNELWPVDFFKVNNENNELVASAIIYRAYPKVGYALFWGDNETGRPLRAMDFLAFKLWEYYKSLGYTTIDLGTSTVMGIPNVGLLRFKETHEAVSLLRFSFSL